MLHCSIGGFLPDLLAAFARASVATVAITCGFRHTLRPTARCPFIKLGQLKLGNGTSGTPNLKQRHVGRTEEQDVEQSSSRIR